MKFHVINRNRENKVRNQDHVFVRNISFKRMLPSITPYGGDKLMERIIFTFIIDLNSSDICYRLFIRSTIAFYANGILEFSWKIYRLLRNESKIKKIKQ